MDQRKGARRTVQNAPRGAAKNTKAAPRIRAARAERVRPARQERPAKPARQPRRRNPANTRAALWLWLFPVGLYFMWTKACTWRKGVKWGITGAMVLVLAAVIVFPFPKASSQKLTGGIQLVGVNPEVEVYGPELPNFIVPGYTSEQTNSVLAEVVNTDVHYVYAADGAKCYHEYECKFAYASSQRLTVYEAYFLGYQPCNRCNPPVYTGQ